ncbi:Protein NO VEIN (Protein EMBRYO DEFECTIVE 2597) [Durusdinium trenchii]|uniref:Protein NO VEIN (Protein EMBRYO DEFECTIVE 2597) n=1 Tax=Durusdinium trenchii TaxID=1381693 RepID=A0ABP0M3T5_9DINO
MSIARRRILIYTNATICEGLEVELQDVKLQGVVSEVGWFNTTVNGYEGTRVTVPNRRILDGTVIDKTNKRFRVCQKHLAAWLMGQSLGRNPVNTVQDDLRNNPNVLQKSVLRILMANRGERYDGMPIEILRSKKPKDVSEYGADFYLRAYFEKSLQGDRFLTLQSQLLIAVWLGNGLCAQTGDGSDGGRGGSPLTPLVPAPVSRDGAEPPQRTPKKWRLMWGSAQAETVQAKILAKRRAMAYLSKQPVCRARRAATRLARWTWLEPSLLQQHNAVEAGGGLHASHASPDGVETVETKGYTQRAADAPPPASSLEEAHEKLERQASCQKIAKVLAERFGCHAPGKGLEDLLLAKESEVVKLQQEVISLRSEREQLELALEAAERRIEELTVANAKAQPVPVKESPKDLVKASSAVMTVDAVLAVGVGPSHVTEPRDEVAAIRHERLQGIQSDTMREMFLGCVELLAADIYASRAHFVLELLQNADDNEYAMGVEPTARFVCEAGEEPYIAVINNEVGLTAQDLVGMCAISKSAKKDKADRTGRKGIGFKSVFAVSFCPHILSGRYTFKFDVRRDRMGYVMPSWLDEEELLCSVPMELRRLHQEGYTVIFLPIGDASEALVKEVEGHLEALDPATLLFMRRLQRIEFRRADGRSSSMQIQARGKAEGVQHEAVQMLTEAGTSGASGPSARSSHEFFVGRRWSKGGDRESQIAIALPTPAVDVPQRAFATLPLCHSGLNLCINADWDVSASRDGVHENGHNERLAEEAAQAFAEVALELGVQLLGAKMCQVISLSELQDTPTGA